MKKMLRSIIIFAVLALLNAGPLLAQGIKDHSALTGAASKAGVEGDSDITLIVGRAISAILTMVGLIFMVLMVYAGIRWMLARGKEEEIEKAKSTIVAALIGIVITVSAYAITFFVTRRFEQ